MSSLWSPLCSDADLTADQDATGVEEGESNIGLPMFVLKACSVVSYSKSGLATSVVLGSESGLVVRLGDGMGSMYSPSLLSPFDKVKRDS